MTKKQAEHREWIINALANHGINRRDAETLIRAEMTLHRWAERTCGDGSGWVIERDDTGAAWNVYHDVGKTRRYRVRDLESGALRRIDAICRAAGVSYYHQTDPRGAALYIIRGDIPEDAHVASCYNRGICVCGR